MHIAELVRQWWRGRAFGALDRAIVAELARDSCFPEADFRRLAYRRRTESALLRRLLQRVGLDPDGLNRNHAGVMRDMTVVCAGCLMTRRCRRDLDRGDDAWSHRQYCPNAETIDALRRGSQPAG